MVASLTTNLRLADAPGNVRIARGEGGLREPSVINVSQLRTIDRDALTERIGRLPADRRREVRDGLALLLDLDGGGAS